MGFFFKILFICSREGETVHACTSGERGRGKGRESQADLPLSTEPNMGLHLMTWVKSKSRYLTDRASQAPLEVLFLRLTSLIGLYGDSGRSLNNSETNEQRGQYPQNPLGSLLSHQPWGLKVGFLLDFEFHTLCLISPGFIQDMF